MTRSERTGGVSPQCAGCGVLLDPDGTCFVCAPGGDNVAPPGPPLDAVDYLNARDDASRLPDAPVKGPRKQPETTPEQRQVAEQVTRSRGEVRRLAEVHEVFARWLGDSYDLQALDAVLAAAAVQRLDGDPAWLLVVSGSGNAKTETVGALAGVGALITSTISGEGALLSGTSTREKAKDATGGLLRRLGASGLLVIKDFTTIISMNKDARAAVLAALREVYDGRWERNIGSEGGRTLTWEGRIVLVGAVTSAYDGAHSVIAAMGDRFALVRVDSGTGRRSAGLQALANVGREQQMRAELPEVVAQLFNGLDPALAVLDGADRVVLLDLADIVTRARTAVERDYRGDVIFAHAPESPTRFMKMLGQIVRGGRALGMGGPASLAVAVRVAEDSMPPMRLAVLGDLLKHPDSTVADVQRRLDCPRASVDREMQALHMLDVLARDATRNYRIRPSVDLSALRVLVDRTVA